jgi:hypothetical protein
MKSNIIFKIDQLHHKYRLDNTELDWNDIDNLFLNDRDLIQSIDYFLTILLENHEVPGKVWDKLLGIGTWYKDNQFLTIKQKRYAAIAIVGYWDQIDITRLDYFI